MSEPTPGRRRRARSLGGVRTGLVAAVVVAAACYVVFGGPLPFRSSSFVLRAVFIANTNLHIPSPVRIAGVDVGEVTAVDRIKGSADAGVVVMRIDPGGLPIHSDATAAIRTRTFLEGNFYVALQPGTPYAPVLGSGATLPAANTSGPVQLDRVLSSLNLKTRFSLEKLLQGLGTALNAPPSAAQRVGQDPAVAALTGAQGLNYSLRYSADAFRSAAIVNQALLGERPRDLSGAVAGSSVIFKALARDGHELPRLIDSLQRVLATLAARQGSLGAALARLPSVLQSALAADRTLDASFAPTRRFARTLVAGIKRLPATITAALPWLAQLSALNSPRELGGRLKQLEPALEHTDMALAPTTALIKGAAQLSQCFTHVLIPTGSQTISADGTTHSGLKLYQELFQSSVGLDGAAQGFDGNGRFLRSTVGGGANPTQTGPLGASGPLFGNSVLPLSGTMPALPRSGSAPKLNGSVPCLTQSAPNLNSAQRGGAP